MFFTINSLNQFEIRDLIILDLPLLNNLHISFTNILAYILISLLILSFNVFTNKNSKVTHMNYNLSKVYIHDTIYSIVENQINKNNGKMYFLFILTLFMFIILNNLIGIIPYSFFTTSYFVSIFLLDYSIYLSQTIQIFNEYLSIISSNIWISYIQIYIEIIKYMDITLETIILFIKKMAQIIIVLINYSKYIHLLAIYVFCIYLALFLQLFIMSVFIYTPYITYKWLKRISHKKKILFYPFLWCYIKYVCKLYKCKLYQCRFSIVSIILLVVSQLPLGWIDRWVNPYTQEISCKVENLYIINKLYNLLSLYSLTLYIVFTGISVMLILLIYLNLDKKKVKVLVFSWSINVISLILLVYFINVISVSLGNYNMFSFKYVVFNPLLWVPLLIIARDMQFVVFNYLKLHIFTNLKGWYIVDNYIENLKKTNYINVVIFFCSYTAVFTLFPFFAEFISLLGKKLFIELDLKVYMVNIGLVINIVSFSCSNLLLSSKFILRYVGELGSGFILKAAPRGSFFSVVLNSSTPNPGAPNPGPSNSGPGDLLLGGALTSPNAEPDTVSNSEAANSGMGTSPLELVSSIEYIDPDSGTITRQETYRKSAAEFIRYVSKKERGLAQFTRQYHNNFNQRATRLSSSTSFTSNLETSPWKTSIVNVNGCFKGVKYDQLSPIEKRIYLDHIILILNDQGLKVIKNRNFNHAPDLSNFLLAHFNNSHPSFSEAWGMKNYIQNVNDPDFETRKFGSLSITKDRLIFKYL